MSQDFRRNQLFALAMLVVMAFGSAGMVIALDAAGNDSLLLRYVLIYGLFYIVPMGIYLRAYPFLKPREVLRIRKVSLRVLLLTLAFAVLIQPFLMMLSTLTSMFFHNYLPDAMATYQKNPLWVTLLAVSLLPAFCEEALCRGIYHSGNRELKLIWAACLNGLFFGLLHMNLQQGIYAFVFGVLSVYLVEASQSIFPSIAVHFLVNATQVILSYGSALNTGEQWYSGLIAFLTGQENLYIWGIITVVLTPAALLCIRWIRRIRHVQET